MSLFDQYPGYDEVIRLHQERAELGKQYLEAEGYQIGDTVYLDGVLPGTIASAFADGVLSKVVVVRVTVTGHLAADYLHDETFRDKAAVSFPCFTSDFTKQPKEAS